VSDFLAAANLGLIHARPSTLQLAESYLTRPLFRQIVARIERLAWHPHESEPHLRRRGDELRGPRQRRSDGLIHPFNATTACRQRFILGIPVKLGVIANEFFDLDLQRMGGFGWAARQVARVLKDPAIGVDVVYVAGELRGPLGQRETVVHGTRLLLRQRTLLADVRRAQAERLDVLLTIDYRPSYRWLCWALPRTPLIVWVRDPRPPEEVAKVDTLRIPGADGVRPKSVIQPDCSSLGTIVRASRWLGRQVLFARPAPHLRTKLTSMIRMDVTDFAFLPNPIDLEPGTVRKSAHPQVVFLARLDPYKRPWLFAELARLFPDVEFLAAGKAHYRGEGTWQPASLPANLRLLGHISDAEKVRVLSSAWVLVNTSIHEGLAVSFLEALACETPIVACVDPGGLVSSFGVYAGRFDGPGLDALPRLAAGLKHLLAHPALRMSLGKAGRRWVEETHSPRTFLASFSQLCARSGLAVRLRR
jgi:glycosyltransferase involved in cell wall biosynthesis